MKIALLTTANSNYIIVVIVVYLDDLRGQHSSTSLIFWAALSVHKTVLMVGGPHQSFTLWYGPEEVKEGGKIWAFEKQTLTVQLRMYWCGLDDLYQHRFCIFKFFISAYIQGFHCRTQKPHHELLLPIWQKIWQIVTDNLSSGVMKVVMRYRLKTSHFYYENCVIMHYANRASLDAVCTKLFP